MLTYIIDAKIDSDLMILKYASCYCKTVPVIQHNT